MELRIIIDEKTNRVKLENPNNLAPTFVAKTLFNIGTQIFNSIKFEEKSIVEPKKDIIKPNNKIIG